MRPRLLMCLSLLTLLTGCAQQQPARPQIDPPPPGLASPCPTGPDYPPGDVPLGALLDTVAQREAAAAECRAKHAALVSAWPR